MKRNARNKCKFCIAALRNVVKEELASLDYQKLLNYTRKCRELTRLYAAGYSTEAIDARYVEVKKSHRQPLKNTTVDLELAAAREQIPDIDK